MIFTDVRYNVLTTFCYILHLYLSTEFTLTEASNRYKNVKKNTSLKPFHLVKTTPPSLQSASSSGSDFSYNYNIDYSNNITDNKSSNNKHNNKSGFNNNPGIFNNNNKKSGTNKSDNNNKVSAYKSDNNNKVSAYKSSTNKSDNNKKVSAYKSSTNVNNNKSDNNKSSTSKNNNSDKNNETSTNNKVDWNTSQHIIYKDPSIRVHHESRCGRSGRLSTRHKVPDMRVYRHNVQHISPGLRRGHARLFGRPARVCTYRGHRIRGLPLRSIWNLWLRMVKKLGPCRRHSHGYRVHSPLGQDIRVCCSRLFKRRMKNNECVVFCQHTYHIQQLRSSDESGVVFLFDYILRFSPRFQYSRFLTSWQLRQFLESLNDHDNKTCIFRRRSRKRHNSLRLYAKRVKEGDRLLQFRRNFELNLKMNQRTSKSFRYQIPIRHLVSICILNKMRKRQPPRQHINLRFNVRDLRSWLAVTILVCHEKYTFLQRTSHMFYFPMIVTCFCHSIDGRLSTGHRNKTVDNIISCFENRRLELKVYTKGIGDINKRIRRASAEAEENLLTEAVRDIQLLEQEAKKGREMVGEGGDMERREGELEKEMRKEGGGGKMESGKGRERGQEREKGGVKENQFENERLENDNFYSRFGESGESDSSWISNTDTKSKIDEITKALKNGDDDDSVSKQHYNVPYSIDRTEIRNHEKNKAEGRKEKHRLYDNTEQAEDAAKQLDEDHERLYEEYLKAYQKLKKHGGGEDYSTDNEHEGGSVEKQKNQEVDESLSSQEDNKISFDHNNKLVQSNKHTHDQSPELKRILNKQLDDYTAITGNNRNNIGLYSEGKQHKHLSVMNKVGYTHKDQLNSVKKQNGVVGKGPGIPVTDPRQFSKTLAQQRPQQMTVTPDQSQYYDVTDDRIRNEENEKKSKNISLSHQHHNDSTTSDTEVGTVAEIVDAGHDSITLNATKSSWKTILHGRRDVIITGCVIVSIAIVVLVVAIVSRLARWNAESNKVGHLRRRQSYRNLGSEEERWKLRKDENSNFSLFVGSSDEEYEYESDPP